LSTRSIGHIVFIDLFYATAAAHKGQEPALPAPRPRRKRLMSSSPSIARRPGRALSPSGDPWLLTPGPLTTSPTVKEAMLHDLGSRDRHFIALNRRVRERLLAIVAGQGTHVCVPLQGSGTFVVEAMIGSLVPMDGKLLVLVNGAY